MQVFDLGSSALYRWRVQPSSTNMVSVSDVQHWANENKIQCALSPGLVFFRHEIDAILFVLRWS